MITRDYLLQLAVSSSEQFEASTDRDERTRLFRLSNQAEAALRWMEEEGLEVIPQIGPFGEKDIKKGDRVLIRKGSVITSMHPKHRHTPKVAGRDYMVAVHNVFPVTLIAIGIHTTADMPYRTSRFLGRVKVVIGVSLILLMLN